MVSGQGKANTRPKPLTCSPCLEYRAEDPNAPLKEHHKMSERQGTREMNALGLKLLRNE
jgi:hypothetical protein